MSRPKKENSLQIQYNNQNNYNKKNYERCIVNMQKGKKAYVDLAAAKEGKSTTQYIMDILSQHIDFEADPKAIEAELSKYKK